MSELVHLVAYGLMILGLIGSLLPLLPGPLLIWLGVLLWAWVDGFQAIGWPTLLILALIMFLAWGSDLILTTVASRRAGVSWRAIGGAVLGGLVGGILLSPLPLLGPILGALGGAVAGMVVVEYRIRGQWQLAWTAARGYLAGFFASIAVQVLLSLLMLVLFAWQAFR